MPHLAPKELAYRNQDGLEVTLLSDACTNEVSIDVVDQRNESAFRLPIAGCFALDAFSRPYAYAVAAKNSTGHVPQTASAK
jgi:hypothetical protein